MRMPEALEYHTADEVAECVPYECEGLYRRLWEILAEAKNPTPLGGDGTVETPDGRLDPDNDDKAPHWWGKLDSKQQRAIVVGLRKDCYGCRTAAATRGTGCEDCVPEGWEEA